jgi:plasmid stabilization system protein ParE
MELRWTAKAVSDLERLYEFLAPLNEPAAARAIQALGAAPLSLLANPRIGRKLEEFEPRDVRRILVGAYELRYEIEGSILYVLRVWHMREDR